MLEHFFEGTAATDMQMGWHTARGGARRHSWAQSKAGLVFW